MRQITGYLMYVSGSSSEIWSTLVAVCDDMSVWDYRERVEYFNVKGDSLPVSERTITKEWVKRDLPPIPQD